HISRRSCLHLYDFTSAVVAKLTPPIHAHLSFFFFNATATTETFTLSLHDALPISAKMAAVWESATSPPEIARIDPATGRWTPLRSEEHTSELQSLTNLVCRLLLEKKKRNYTTHLIAYGTLPLNAHNPRNSCLPHYT